MNLRNADVLEIIAKLATITATLVGGFGVFLAANSYRQSVRLKRAEWLLKLYQEFMKSSDTGLCVMSSIIGRNGSFSRSTRTCAMSPKAI